MTVGNEGPLPPKKTPVELLSERIGKLVVEWECAPPVMGKDGTTKLIFDGRIVTDMIEEFVEGEIHELRAQLMRQDVWTDLQDREERIEELEKELADARDKADRNKAVLEYAEKVYNSLHIALDDPKYNDLSNARGFMRAWRGNFKMALPDETVKRIDAARKDSPDA